MRLLDDSLSDHESYDTVMSTDGDGKMRMTVKRGYIRLLLHIRSVISSILFAVFLSRGLDAEACDVTTATEI